MTYLAVFIDWDNTLGDFDKSALLAMQQIYEEEHLNRYFSSFQQWLDIYSPHNLQLWEQYGKSLITKEQLSKDRFNYPFRVIGHNDLQDFAIYIEQKFEELAVQHTQLLPHARDIIQYLADKYPLTLITNGFPEVQHRKLQLTDMGKYFSHIIISEEVGYTKPNPDIFRLAIERNKAAIPTLSEHDVIMIGDHHSVDIVGAQNANIDQIYFCPNTEQNNALPATYHVHNLLEIKQIL